MEKHATSVSITTTSKVLRCASQVYILCMMTLMTARTVSALVENVKLTM